MQIAAGLAVQHAAGLAGRPQCDAFRSQSAAAAPITPSPVASFADQADEIARLRRELDRARTVRDI
nr:MetaGeneMark_Unknown Function [uncultured bacterium]